MSNLPQKRGMREQEWLKAIWKNGFDSVWCEVGEAAEFEANIMVEGLAGTRYHFEILLSSSTKAMNFPKSRLSSSWPFFTFFAIVIMSSGANIKP